MNILNDHLCQTSSGIQNLIGYENLVLNHDKYLIKLTNYCHGDSLTNLFQGVDYNSRSRITLQSERPLVLLINQLMVHQNLAKMNYYQTFIHFQNQQEMKSKKTMGVLKFFMQELK